MIVAAWDYRSWIMLPIILGIVALALIATWSK